MSLHVIRARAKVERPTVEEHHPYVDTFVTGSDHPFAQAFKISLVELLQIKLWFAILGLSRPGSLPGLRRHAQVIASTSRLGLEQLPAPETDEIVSMVLEKFEISLIIESLGGLITIGPGSHAIMEIIPDVRAGQINCFLLGCRGNGEIAGIGL